MNRAVFFYMRIQVAKFLVVALATIPFIFIQDQAAGQSQVPPLNPSQSNGNAAQNPNSEQNVNSQSNDQNDSTKKAGYSNSDSLEGPDGVVSEIAQDDIAVGSLFQTPRAQRFLQPWFNAKRRLDTRYGLKLHLSYQALYQTSSETLTSEYQAAGGRVQAQGLWTIGRKSKNPGSLSFRVEDRRALGTEIPPTSLGSQFGSINLTGSGFSDFQFALTELAWRQTAHEGRMKWVFGKISAVSWYNAHALSSALTGYQNSSPQSSTSKPSVGRGLGGGAAFRLGQRFVVLGGIHDANAQTTESPFKTIGEGDFFYSFELRYHTTTFERRRWDQIRVQSWYVDPTNDGATLSAYGVAFLASQLFDDFYMPFVVGGVANGDATNVQADLSVGVGFAFDITETAAREILGISCSWQKPTNGTLQDQFSTEAFYRVQLFKNVAITPGWQLILNPTANPSQDMVWVSGVRMRITL